MNDLLLPLFILGYALRDSPNHGDSDQGQERPEQHSHDDVCPEKLPALPHEFPRV
jgi:hypothetical protein